MDISMPFLRTKDFWWKDYTTLWRNFTTYYNAEKPSREKLKAAHMNVYYRLINMAAKNIRKDNKELSDHPELSRIKSGQWFLVKGASKYLFAHILNTSTDSIKRHFKRLEEAKVITTHPNEFRRLIGREKRRNEVLINPDFLLIYDYEQPEFVPTSRWLGETQKQGFQKEKSAICRGVSSISTVPESSNNKIMPGDTVEKGVSHPVDGLLNKNSNTTKLDATLNLNGQEYQSKPESQKKCEKPHETEEKDVLTTETKAVPAENDGNYQKIQGVPAEKIPEKRDNMAWLRTKLAVDLYTFMLKMLFKTHNIYQAEATMAIQYLEKTYFGNVVDEQKGANYMKIYKWRVSKAASWINRSGFDFSNTYPCHYLDVNNPKGFVATRGWYEQSERDRERKTQTKAINMQRLQEKESLQNVINLYLENPNVHQFNRSTQWINDHLPHLYNDFIEAINLNK
ncbi:MAG: hypothetical protein N4A71_10975 [Carboxylicivirga sp.]|jgi:hypothetical protein|nr:hypothetical protein [Carboxylicivirga sp.]